MPHKFRRYKLLLDENFPPKYLLPRLNGRHDVKHLVSDLRKSGIPDNEVYLIARKQNRLLLTFNDKDFLAFAGKSKTAGIIGVSADVTPEQIDKKITSLLAHIKASKLYGKFTYISQSSKRPK